MASYNRTKRIAEEIKKVISSMLISGIKDPRITSMVSVTSDSVTAPTPPCITLTATSSLDNFSSDCLTA